MELSSEQQEALINFQAITDNWDTDQAIIILTSHNWDITSATNSHFSSGTAQSPQYHPQPRQQTQQPQNFSQITSGVSYLFPNTFLNQTQSSSAANFINKMQQICPFLPRLSTRGLSQVIQEAKNRRKLLFVFLDSSAVPPEYYSEVLFTQINMQVLNQHFITWGVDSASPEGQLASRSLVSQQYPTIVISKPKNPLQPEVLGRLEGIRTCDQVFEMIQGCIQTGIQTNFDPFAQQRQLREMQQYELKEAERLFLEQERQEREKAFEKQRDEEERIQKEEEENRQREIELQEKLRAIGEEPPESEQTAFLSLRLFDGRKIQRRFFKQGKVEMIHLFLETQVSTPFQIVSGFPPQIVEKTLTIEEAGLSPKAVVHVREVLNQKFKF